jgi:hypothetical protein
MAEHTEVPSSAHVAYTAYCYRQPISPAHTISSVSISFASLAHLQRLDVMVVVWAITWMLGTSMRLAKLTSDLTTTRNSLLRTIIDCGCDCDLLLDTLGWSSKVGIRARDAACMRVVGRDIKSMLVQRVLQIARYPAELLRSVAVLSSIQVLSVARLTLAKALRVLFVSP